MSLYGNLLLGGVGGIIGPQIVAFMKDNYPDKAGFYAFIIGSILMIVGLGLSYLYKGKRDY